MDEHGTTPSRKADHLRINIDHDVRGKHIESGFDDYRFEHVALPEIDLSEVDIATTCFGRRLKAPILISCMTGGTPQARTINERLAEAAQTFGFAMGLGSGRVVLEDAASLESFNVRAIAPDIALFANLGAIQLKCGYGADDCRRLVESLGADVLVLHLNALQEALQPGGNTNFAGLLRAIGGVCGALEFPVIVKEVGWGLAPDIVRALLDCGVAGVDVAGAGGTSWSEVERLRTSDPVQARVAKHFDSWGIPTAPCIRSARAIAPECFLIGSGGIRHGIDVAKAIALGANLAGLAGPFLRAADAGPAALTDLALELTATLRLTMFATASGTIDELRRTARLVTLR